MLLVPLPVHFFPTLHFDQEAFTQPCSSPVFLAWFLTRGNQELWHFQKNILKELSVLSCSFTSTPPSFAPLVQLKEKSKICFFSIISLQVLHKNKPWNINLWEHKCALTDPCYHCVFSSWKCDWANFVVMSLETYSKICIEVCSYCRLICIFFRMKYLLLHSNNENWISFFTWTICIKLFNYAYECAYAKSWVYVHIGEIKMRRVIFNLIKTLTHTTVK